MNLKITELKEEILTLLQSKDKPYKVEIVILVFKNKGFTSEEFARAYNALVMEGKVRGNEEEMWLHK